ncbi:hypothetical protein D9619_000783 [Psilocybe cf. subviscida]|uniref:Uncharacterized protein n=1 Tax=Psilocybe cf. subviscida TaxID=2480587 RepID=A0A8H5BE56_9AGAR|nr:hypothetical protein D9619_000783 [Psilocybe cf. subviscida]
MDYTPRYPQPFTLKEAISLDVGLNTPHAEIARLQNSLSHLKETQAFLKADLDESGETDPEVLKAFEENQGVIGSQEERVSMLKMALTEKGIVGGAHYELPNTTQTPQTNTTQSSEPATTTVTSSTASEEVNGEGDGVYL